MGRSWNSMSPAVSNVQPIVQPIKTVDMKRSVEKTSPVIFTESKSNGSIVRSLLGIIGAVGIIAGVVLFGTSYINRFNGANEGSPMTVEVSVKEITEQVDTEKYTNAEAQVTKYHLTGTYDLSGKEQNIVLNESYYSEAEAKDYIGTTRKVSIDSVSLKELVATPINYVVCGLPICVGLIFVIVSMIITIISKRKKRE